LSAVGRSVRWIRLVSALASGTFWALLLSIPFVPAATPYLLDLLEQRFPTWVDSGQPPAGILVPGGAVADYVVKGGGSRGELRVGRRVAAAADVAKKYPSAKLVLAGSGSETPIPILNRAGIAPSQVVVETEASSTYEDARNAARLLHPSPNERWVVVTSAAHMPRSIGAFRAAGFRVEAYPVYDRWIANEDPARQAWREAVALVAYRLTGRSSAFLPGP
jgi:uncharacterized SAM-binding protein YcdF (DUF218 family)